MEEALKTKVTSGNSVRDLPQASLMTSSESPHVSLAQCLNLPHLHSSLEYASSCKLPGQSSYDPILFVPF